MGPFPKIINTRNQQAQAMRKETKVLKKSTKKVHVRVWVKDQWVDGTIANTAATAVAGADNLRGETGAHTSVFLLCLYRPTNR